MTDSDCKEISARIGEFFKDLLCQPYRIDAASIGPVSRPRYYWTSFRAPSEDIDPHPQQQRKPCVTSPKLRGDPPSLINILENGASKLENHKAKFPTAVKWIPRGRPPESPAGIDDCDQETLDRWAASEFAMPPYQFKRQHLVQPEWCDECMEWNEPPRPPNAEERERMHGFRTGHTARFLL